MAKIEFPSGAWVEYREDLKAKDKFAAQAAVSQEISGDQIKVYALAMTNTVRNALLCNIITKWSYPVPVPSQNDFIEDKESYLGEQMSLKDYNALAEAVQPLVDEVSGVVVENPKGPSKTSE
jgi:hypothetical protein